MVEVLRNLSEIEQSPAALLIINLATFPPLRHAVTLTFDPLILNVGSKSDFTWSNSIQNLSEIEQFPAKLFTIYHFFQG